MFTQHRPSLIETFQSNLAAPSPRREAAFFSLAHITGTWPRLRSGLFLCPIAGVSSAFLLQTTKGRAHAYLETGTRRPHGRPLAGQ